METKRRTIVKSIIWRIIGVLWTFVGAYIIILLVPRKYSTALILATIIAAYHHLSRLVMYYFYERVWMRVNWGYAEHDSGPVSLRQAILWIAGIVLLVALLVYFLIFVLPLIEPKQ